MAIKLLLHSSKFSIRGEAYGALEVRGLSLLELDDEVDRGKAPLSSIKELLKGYLWIIKSKRKITGLCHFCDFCDFVL